MGIYPTDHTRIQNSDDYIVVIQYFMSMGIEPDPSEAEEVFNKELSYNEFGVPIGTMRIVP
jgi:hypothetical protein